MRRLRSETGQTGAELVGMLLLVALIIGALATSGVPNAIAGGMQDAICDIGGGKCGGTPPTPERTSAPRTPQDGDGDGLSDARERELGLDPTTADADGDGLPDGRELEQGSDVRNPDTDGDGVSDADEAASGGAMRPTDADSDDDGLTDAEELAVGTDPGEADGDGDFGQLGDGLTDAEELEHGTDPNKFDTDGDKYSDGWEVENGRDPTEADTPLSEKVLDLFLDDPFSLGRGALIKGGAKKIVEKVLRKGVRNVADAKSIKDAAKIRKQRLEALRTRLRRTPTGMSRAEFERLGSRVRAGAGRYGDDIRVHGSRANGTARPDSDVDIAIRVDAKRFDEIMRERFKTPNPGSAKERTMQHAGQTGKIQSGELGLRGLRKELEREFGKDVDISVIRVGGEFDRGPWVGVP